MNFGKNNYPLINRLLQYTDARTPYGNPFSLSTSAHQGKDTYMLDWLAAGQLIYWILSY